MGYDSEQEDNPRSVVGPLRPERFVTRIKRLMGDGKSGAWTANRFEPPSDSNNIELAPDQVFRPRLTDARFPENVERFCIRRCFVPKFSVIKTMCIFTQGVCLGDEDSSVISTRAGVAFVFKGGKDGTVSFALENEGVDGQVYKRTNDRAKLRAVIAGLQFKFWWGEGWQRIAVVTDSEYVAHNATSSIRSWASQEWRAGSGELVENKDLWMELSNVLGSYAQGGCEIIFWVVPKQFNLVAHQAAVAAAEQGGGKDQFMKTFDGIIF